MTFAVSKKKLLDVCLNNARKFKRTYLLLFDLKIEKSF